MAVHADDVLHRVRRVGTLSEAGPRDCAAAGGVTRRRGLQELKGFDPASMTHFVER